MKEPSEASVFFAQRIEDRQVTELIGVARGMTADGILNDDEFAYLYKWLAANDHVTKNPLISSLFDRATEMLADGVIDDDERDEMFSNLSALCANHFELGEPLKSTTLPLDNPAPSVVIHGSKFCFTGTFAFGRRKECEQAVAERGGEFGGLTKKTRYLVIGEYSTTSWMQTTYGRKIESAVEMRTAGAPISIISEQHWVDHL